LLVLSSVCLDFMHMAAAFFSATSSLCLVCG
jgi:hypothetical protein